MHLMLLDVNVRESVAREYAENRTTRTPVAPDAMSQGRIAMKHTTPRSMPDANAGEASMAERKLS